MFTQLIVVLIYTLQRSEHNVYYQRVYRTSYRVLDTLFIRYNMRNTKAGIHGPLVCVLGVCLGLILLCIMMTPLLLINYKMKSVAHSP